MVCALMKPTSTTGCCHGRCMLCCAVLCCAVLCCAVLCCAQWREAELLTLAPHTFEALRQVPELQQLIAFTAVEAVMAAGAPKEQLGSVQEMAHTIWKSDAQEELSSAASFVRVFHQVSVPGLHLQHYQQARYDSTTDLLMGLTPHMRLALTAEVAAGMLCPG